MYARVPLYDPTPEGIYDYAIDKFVPVRFFDYIRQEASDRKPAATIELQQGARAPSIGLTYLQIGRMGLAFE
jgi:hypothetical protein